MKVDELARLLAERAGITEVEAAERIVGAMITSRSPLDDIVESLLNLRDSLDEAPEKRCRRCGGPNITWSAPSPLWNQVMRDGDINGDWQYDELICPICFAQIAEEKNIAYVWQLSATEIRVPLQTVTPSGRVWNEKTWHWDDPK